MRLHWFITRSLLLCVLFAHTLFAYSLPQVLAEEEKAPISQGQPKLEFSNPVLGELAGQEWSGIREDAMVEVSEAGLFPAELEMKIRQGILFFYNNTKDSQITFEIDFGKNAMVCFSSATPNLAFKGEGKLVSTRAVAPGNFASTCFPNIGTYAYRVFGISGQKAPLEGKIIVMPRG